VLLGEGARRREGVSDFRFIQNNALLPHTSQKGLDPPVVPIGFVLPHDPVQPRLPAPQGHHPPHVVGRGHVGRLVEMAGNAQLGRGGFHHLGPSVMVDVGRRMAGGRSKHKPVRFYSNIVVNSKVDCGKKKNSKSHQ
jgi:hypothetical protein